jgi:hypothetical protein
MRIGSRLGLLGLLLASFVTACVEPMAVPAQTGDDSAKYLKRSMVAFAATTLAAAAATEPGIESACLPAGLPVFDVTSAGAKRGILTINKSVLGGWGATYKDPIPTDCRDSAQFLYQLKPKTTMSCTDGSGSCIEIPDPNDDSTRTKYYGVTGIPSARTVLAPVTATVLAPYLATVAGDPSVLAKNSATFKSGFLANPLSVDQMTAAPTATTGTITPAKACLPRGTRINVWIDRTDMARVIVEPVDSDVKQCDATAWPGSDANKTTTYYAPTTSVAYSITSWEFASGALVVPFKYYLQGDRSFVGSASVGPYIGVRIRWSASGTEWTTALFGGYTTVSVPASTASGGKTTAGVRTFAPAATSAQPATTSQSNSISGFTGGVAFLTSLGDNTKAQAGVVLGWDFVSDNAKWVNNRKMWLALQFGYSFF